MAVYSGLVRALQAGTYNGVRYSPGAYFHVFNCSCWTDDFFVAAQQVSTQLYVWPLGADEPGSVPFNPAAPWYSSAKPFDESFVYGLSIAGNPYSSGQAVAVFAPNYTYQADAATRPKIS